MTSIGYDIVDLSLTDPSRNSRFQFYRHILSPSDIACPFTLSFHRYLWLCWSVKEAVYKYACRLQPGLTFSPTRMVVEALDDVFCGRVRWEGQVYHTVSSFGADHVVSVAHRGEAFTCGFARATGDLSGAVRRLVLGEVGPGWTVVSRADGCPTLVGTGAPPAPAERPLSFSHHGAYAGYSLVLS